jgi:molybdenum cofactor cytidylyltransferase
MGQAKLLLPLAGRPLVLHTIAAWQQSKVHRVIVVVRPGDEPLAGAVRTADVDIVIPGAPPPDMKASLQAALRHIERVYNPIETDAFLVAPADMPRLSPAIINRLIQQHETGPKLEILVPMLHGKHGHPVLFPWPLASQVHALPSIAGLDALVHDHQTRFVPSEDLVPSGEYPFADIDTPEEFHRIAGGQ